MEGRISLRLIIIDLTTAEWLKRGLVEWLGLRTHIKQGKY